MAWGCWWPGATPRPNSEYTECIKYPNHKCRYQNCKYEYNYFRTVLKYKYQVLHLWPLCLSCQLVEFDRSRLLLCSLPQLSSLWKLSVYCVNVCVCVAVNVSIVALTGKQSCRYRWWLEEVNCCSNWDQSRQDCPQEMVSTHTLLLYLFYVIIINWPCLWCC